MYAGAGAQEGAGGAAQLARLRHERDGDEPPRQSVRRDTRRGQGALQAPAEGARDARGALPPGRRDGAVRGRPAQPHGRPRPSYAVTGNFSGIAAKEAAKYGDVTSPTTARRTATRTSPRRTSSIIRPAAPTSTTAPTTPSSAPPGTMSPRRRRARWSAICPAR